MKKEFFVEVKDHVVKGETLLIKAFRNLQSGRYRCELQSTNKRSISQNSYVHLVFKLAQKGLYDAGWQHITTMERAKQFYKEMFLTIDVVNEQTGEVKKYVRHTSELPKEEMTLFIEQVREASLEYTGVYIPTPDEYRANYSKYDLVTLAA